MTKIAVRADSTVDGGLAARIAELEAENSRLRARGLRKHRFSWRTFSAILCIVVAAVLVPVSVISAWTRAELTDESRFVETFAPLAGDPAVQAAVTDAVVTLIDEQIDIDATTDALFDGIEELGLGDRAITALDMLRAPAAAGVHTLIRSGVTTFVSSDLFADVWTAALRESHRALIAAVTPGAPDTAVIIDGSGHISIQLAPIIEQVKDHLLANGLSIASQIPAVDATFVVAQADALALISPIYALATTVGYVIPLLSIALFVVGIAVARNRRRAVIGVGIGLAVPAATLLAALAVGSSVLVASTASMDIPSDAVAAVYERTISRMTQSSATVLLVGVFTALLAGLISNAPIRRAMIAVNARVRSVARVDQWAHQRWREVLRQQRVVLRGAVIGLALAAVVLGSLHVAGVMLTVSLSLVAWWALAILEAQPGVGEPSPAEPKTARATLPRGDSTFAKQSSTPSNRTR
jgi:hypothetical protein